ncbi:response regulator [Planctomicrobium sp. SH661]|uniref:response regulator n=1 Tax=Planctomicrobium sp. SH661 TaxID=3448124 RepID=UPI003F5B17BE
MELTRLDGLNVLFVDDRRDARFVVDHILRDAGAEVTLLENGQEAVELVNCPPQLVSSFDVMVIDVNMPVLDGLSATRCIRRQGHRMPIIALTAGAMEEDRRECLAAGCDEYLSKPIDGERLVEMVHQLVHAERTAN